MKHETKGNNYKIDLGKFRLDVGNFCLVFKQESGEALEQFAHGRC